MALQTESLVMIGLGMSNDTPPNPFQPPLLDGIHLRWAFPRQSGFPWYGFYLFRRPHQRGSPKCLSEATAHMGEGIVADNPLDTPYGQVRSDTKLVLRDDFPTPAGGGPLEFDLDGRRYLQLNLLPEYVSRRVEVRIGFRKKARVKVVALRGKTPVVQTFAAGEAGITRTLNLESDTISAVEIGPGPAALIDICFVPISVGATQGWGLVPEFPYPLRLPVTQPDYPCTPGAAEDLSSARNLARQRIHYGDPDSFAGPRIPIPSDGTISVLTGSPLVTGAGTEWASELAGAVLQVNGDPTAYTIAMVVAADKLVLSRGYAGASANGTAYEISQDNFGQLHDYLIHLVTGGSASGPMANRLLPTPVYDAGTISVSNGSAVVQGSDTDFDVKFIGLSLQVVRDAAGTVSVNHGSRLVTGVGTDWRDDWVGSVLQVAADPTAYTIKAVNSGTRLILERGYLGQTGAGKSYSITEKSLYTVLSIEAPNQLTLNRKYIGRTGEEKRYRIVGRLQPAESGRPAPRMSRHRPLDWILLSALNPALAQMVGLYWVDQKADPAVSYDYLIVADHEGRGDLDAKTVLSLLLQTGFGHLDGYIVFNKRVAPAPPLPAPRGLRVYALPTGGGSLDGNNSAGLRWDLGVAGQEAFPAIYHLWRATLGDGEEPEAADRYNLITRDRPILVADSLLDPGNRPPPPPDWPHLPLYAIDKGLPEGWYSYQISAVDIFGRHSPNSAAGPWYQWAPVPEPRPWYYRDPPADAAVHPFAVRLLDKLPPPPPTGIEAYALDPLDRTVLQDAAYNTWRAANEGAVGLRLRWLWTEAHMRQARDTREFRIYFQPGRTNVVEGRTVIISSAGEEEEESVVWTDIENRRPAGFYAGWGLQVGSKAFAVVSSEADSPLQLRVRNIGSRRDIRPRAKAPCTLAIPPDYAVGTVALVNGSATVAGTGTGWRAELAGRTFRVPEESAEYTIVRVDTETQLTLDRGYDGTSGSAKTYLIGHPLFVDYRVATNWQQRILVVGYDEYVKLSIPAARDPNGFLLLGGRALVSGSVVSLGDSPDLSGVRGGIDYLFLEKDSASADKIYRIVDVDNVAETVTVDGTPDVGIDRSPWVIGLPQPLRQYDVFLPAPDTGEAQPFTPSLAEPIVYAHIGVAAVDDKGHTLDDPGWSAGDWGGRPGNEGRVGPLATIFRVRRDPLPTPLLPSFDSVRIYATPADYHSRSFYTFHWPRMEHLKVLIFRALDETLFQVDWDQRREQPLGPDDPNTFPVEFPPERRAVVADELNGLQALKQTNGVDKVEVLARYRSLSNDALRVLAGLPGNERAFTQITIQPLDPDDSSYADRPGPDNPPNFPTDANLRIYIDTLDGRATNRYFYRAAYVDGAHNRSALSLSSPPVYLPDIVPPSRPRFLKVVGGDRRVTLQWTANREPAMRRYVIYRTESKANGRDIRLMGPPVADLPAAPLLASEGEVDLGAGTDVVTVERVYAAAGFDPSSDMLSGQTGEQYLPAPSAPIGTRAAGLSAPNGAKVVAVYRDSRRGLQYTPFRNGHAAWIDEGLVGARTYYYRVVATREVETQSGIVTIHSWPSDLTAGRAVDLTPPEPPTWQQGEWIRQADGRDVIRLVWTVTEPGMRCIVQRRLTHQISWPAVTNWLTEAVQLVGPPKVWEYRFDDGGAKPDRAYEYRIKLISPSGNMNRGFNVISVAAHRE